ncbi:AAA domain-containing protein [Actinomyces bowdenii]|uniref:AAA domain-containing protein n=1 Tax=Actinomyces bowdenii TaxID=131109 RepID=UPI00214A8D7B|nr:AAA domain-containing protein [Actinomyces bowdenii]
MINPNEMLVMAPQSGGGPLRDCTWRVYSISAHVDRKQLKVTYARKDGSEGRSCRYRHPAARLLRPHTSFELPPDEVAVLSGEYWTPPLTVTVFVDQWDDRFSMVRVSRHRKGRAPASRTCPIEEFSRVRSSAHAGGPAHVLDYLRRAVEVLEPRGSANAGRSGCDDRCTGLLRGSYERMRFVHPESALAAYLEGRNSTTSFPGGPVILPFRSNEDQRHAVVKALSHQVSVIDGPPGTGKTETILNLIANILLDPGKSVGVVSFGNAAVDNVRDKLEDLGIDFVAARVGSSKRVKKFLHDQDDRDPETGREARNVRLERWLEQPLQPLPVPTAGVGPGGEEVDPAESLVDQVLTSERQLLTVWRATRELAVLRNLIDAYALEAAHLDRRAASDELPDLTLLPLLRKDSERILDYLAETHLLPDLPHGIAGLIPRVRRYFRYGRLKDLDPTDAATVLRLEKAFYANRIEELKEEELLLQGELENLDADAIRANHEELSFGLLGRELRRRYSGRARVCFDEREGAIFKRTPEFIAEYPVVLTTCHSIRWNLSEGTLLDWVVIDEASQTNPLAAALAMSRARNVVIVGDLKQLGPILDKKSMRPGERLPVPPAPGYDVDAHSILSSVADIYGPALPRTMLKEHFRCVPAIAEFCNQMYYEGALIPCRPAGDVKSDAPLAVIRTAPGNHMRSSNKGAEKGTDNRREVSEIEEYLDGILEDLSIDPSRQDKVMGGDYDLGVCTPYRLQAKRIDEALGERFEDVGERYWSVQTVHKFQGRGVREMVFSTVVDETRLGHIKLRFVDDPRLLNVAVSRAKDRFVLVTNRDGVPRSTHIKALIDYIRFRDPDQIVDGQVLSVFDLLYREYSQRLAHFAARVDGGSRFLSENIMWTLLGDILTDPAYKHLAALPQVRLRDLLPDTSLLNDRQRKFVRSVSAVDFAVYHRVTRRLLLAIEVNGTAFHENNPVQQERDETKRSILAAYGVDVLALPTNGSGEEAKIREALDRALHERPGGAIMVDEANEAG